MSHSFISTIYYEPNDYIYNHIYLLINNALHTDIQENCYEYNFNNDKIIICPDMLHICWTILDYDRIRIIMNALAESFGDVNYYWDLRKILHCYKPLIGECRSGTFELDGEISVRHDNEYYIIKAECMGNQLKKIK